MRILSLYIIRQVAVATLAVILVLAGAIWLSQSLRFIDWIVNRGLPLTSFVYVSMLVLPSFLVVILPVALFSAVLFTFNKLQTDSEVIVMRAVGIGPGRLVMPVLGFALLIALIGYAFNLYLLPASYREFKDLQFQIRNSYSGILLQEGVFSTLDKGLTIFVREQGQKGDLYGIMVHDERKPEQPVTMIAERGAIVTTPEGPRILMVEGNRQELNRTDGRVNFLFFERYTIDFDRVTGEDVGERQRDTTERFLDELLHPGPDVPARMIGRFRSEAHQRLAGPLYTIAYTLVALAALLAGNYSRRGQSRRVMLAIAAAIGLQVISFGLANLVTRNAAMVPAMYGAPVLAWLVAIWFLVGWRPRSRPVAPPVAG